MAKIFLILLFIVVKFSSIFSLVRGSQISCTFDSNLCGWHSDTSKKFQWRRGTGQTEDRTSGPLNDHTCANYKGEYLFISGGDAEGPKDIAVVESDIFSIDNETSLTFWYIMNGFGTGTLSLSVVYDNTTDEIWKKDGRQGKDWVKQTLTMKTGRMKLQFKGTVRIPVGSDVAIDDIHLSSESQTKELNKTHCKVSTTTSTTTTTTTLPTTTTAERMNKTHKASSLTTVSSSNPSSSSCLKIVGKTDILPGTCDFETDICGIKITANDSNKAVTWGRTNKVDGLLSRNNSIYEDHTMEKINTTRGFYLAFRNSWSFFNSKLIASVETPAIYATHACLSFWYNVPTKYSNLKVSTRDYTGKLTTMWSIDNFIPNTRVANMTGWHKESLSVIQDPPFTVVFQSNNNMHGARVGLDDIKIIGTNTNTRTNPVSGETTPLKLAATTTTTIEPKTEPSKESSTMFNLSTITHLVSYLTDKKGKKTTSLATKKPSKTEIVKGDTDKETEEDKYERTSTIVGSAVGAVFALLLIVLIVYSIAHNKSKAKKKRRQEMNKRTDEQLNGGVSNAGCSSRPYLSTSISNEKPKLNGHAGKANDQITVYSVSQVNMLSQENKQKHLINGDAHLNGHTSPVVDEEKLTRL